MKGSLGNMLFLSVFFLFFSLARTKSEWGDWKDASGAINGIKGGLDEWLNRIDNCWQFRSRQLAKTLITSFLRPVCSHEATGTTRFERNVSSRFNRGLRRLRCWLFHVANAVARGYRYLSRQTWKGFSKTLHFNYPRGQIKEITAQKSTFSIPLLCFVDLPSPFFHVFAWRCWVRRAIRG